MVFKVIYIPGRAGFPPSTVAPVKMDGWNTIVPFRAGPIFRFSGECELLVLGSVAGWHRLFLIEITYKKRTHPEWRRRNPSWRWACVWFFEDILVESKTHTEEHIADRKQFMNELLIHRGWDFGIFSRRGEVGVLVRDLVWRGAKCFFSVSAVWGWLNHFMFVHRSESRWRSPLPKGGDL